MATIMTSDNKKRGQLLIAILFCLIIIAAAVYIIFLSKTEKETSSSQLQPAQQAPQPQVLQSTQRPYDEVKYDRAVGNQEPPEYETAQWTMPAAKSVAISPIEWPDAFNPSVRDLPDSIWWNFFGPNKMRAVSRREKEMLQKNGFFLEEVEPLKYISYDDMIDLYDDLHVAQWGRNYSTVPVFISSDLLLHVYHVVFDRMLQDVEEKKFYFLVEQLTKIMTDHTKRMLDNVQDEKIREAAIRNYAFFSVAAKLLDTSYTVDASIAQPVAEELAEIASASEAKVSPVLGRKQDYTQFKIRGHYTKSPRLGRYFHALMWFGRSPFPMDDEASALSALLITKTWSAPEIKSLWLDLAKPMSALIGQPDDMDPPDLENLARQIFGNDLSEATLLDSSKLNRLILLAKSKSHAQIVDKAMRGTPHPEEIECQFRFIGQRFIPDSYIFTKLTSPRIGTDLQPRNMPTSADVMTVLGSPIAEKIALEDSAIPGYKDHLYQLKQEFDSNPAQVWAQSMYWSWLNTLRALLRTKDKHYPFFMRSDLWASKSLLTSLGSWAELRHDMILYSKQSGAEMGEGEEETPPTPPQPKSYVEADLSFFNRFISLVQQVATTLSDYRLLSEEYLRKNSLFLDHVLTLRDIVRKELLNKKISNDEYEFMMTFSGEISGIVIPEGSGDIIEDKFKQMALIADVHTDYLKHTVLEVGVGIPQRIFVAVKDKSGGSRICVGYVYSYYEFKQPMDQRLTDDEWKANFYPAKHKSVDDKEPPWIKGLRIESH
jgi:hypothetical protein